MPQDSNEEQYVCSGYSCERTHLGLEPNRFEFGNFGIWIGYFGIRIDYIRYFFGIRIDLFDRIGNFGIRKDYSVVVRSKFGIQHDNTTVY